MTIPDQGITEPLKYPKGAFFILIGYLLERFVYYGLFGGVVFYMQRVLHFTSSNASTIKAIMEGLIYLAPIAGAVLADTYLGKVRTVFTMCCIYTIGSIIFSLSSVSPIMASIAGTQASGIGGILLLGLSAGLMKAVYTSLGPDQFKVPEQRRQQQRFFYAFYWMINAGAFLGQILTAQLRATVQCFGDDCYALPFFILCGLMVISTAVFYSGKRLYIEAPPDPMLINAIKCISYAAKKSITEKEKPVKHWIDRAKPKFDETLIEDVKKTLRILLLFVTYPFFWALFYQTSTGMIFQAKRLYDRIGSYRIPAEVTSSINPLLILILIPLFEFAIYPLLNRKQILKSTTSRMVLGMALGCISFILYGTLNTSVEQTLLGSKQAQINVYNPENCIASLSADWLPKIMIPPGNEIKVQPIDIDDKNVSRIVHIECGSLSSNVDVVLEEMKETTLVVFSNKVLSLKPTSDYLKNKDAEAKVRIITDTLSHLNKNISSFQLIYNKLIENIFFDGEASDFKILSPQNYTLKKENKTLGFVDIRQDGVYVVIVKDHGFLFNMTKPSDTHVAWLFPQYLVITTGEVLFSISSMDFAYTEAPTSMKSVMQAANLLTITVGLWMFAFFNKLNAAIGIFDHRASNEAFTYAVGMGINTLIFYFLARYYDTRQKKHDKENEIINAAKENPAYQEDKL